MRKMFLIFLLVSLISGCSSGSPYYFGDDSGIGAEISEGKRQMKYEMTIEAEYYDKLYSGQDAQDYQDYYLYMKELKEPYVP